MGRFFDQDGPLIGFMNTLTAIVGLQILTVFFSIPIVTGGAAIAAMHFYIMQMREGTEGKMIPTFWTQFKGNLKSATPIWLLFLLAAFLIYGDYRLISEADILPTGFIVPIAIIGALVAAVAVFAFPLLGKFENTMRGTLKNAVILALANFPRTLTMIVIYLVCFFLFIELPMLFPLMMLMGISLPSYLSSFLYWPVIKALIPEEDTANEEEELFSDDAVESL